METEDDKVQRMVREHEQTTQNLLQKMRAAQDAGNIYTISVEEIQLLESFRKFKKKIRKPKTFIWMTCPVEYAGDIIQPEEVNAINKDSKIS